MCISYVKLSSKTLNRVAYRLPRIADLLAKVSRSTVFSKFDLLSGFYQIRMRASDIPKTGFSTPLLISVILSFAWCPWGFVVPQAHFSTSWTIASQHPSQLTDAQFHFSISLFISGWPVCAFSLACWALVALNMSIIAPARAQSTREADKMWMDAQYHRILRAHNRSKRFVHLIYQSRRLATVARA